MVNTVLSELPDILIASINKATFRFAYFLPERGRYIVEHVLPDGRKEELEYDVIRGRCLTIDERKAELPPDRRSVRPDNVTVSYRYFIDDETSRSCFRFDASDETGHPLLSLVSLVHVTREWNEDGRVTDALRSQRFPATYATWPREQKIAHWAALLHRFRRAQGESGGDEDAIYTPALISDLEQTDPDVRDLLPEILAQVGQLEQTPADEAIAAFSSRTGIDIDP